MSSNRQSLRSELRLKRQQLSIVQQNDAASALLSILVTNIHLKAHEKIALYLSNDGEISPAELCKWCWTQNIEVYLPVINDKALVFARYGRSSNWKKTALVFWSRLIAPRSQARS